MILVQSGRFAAAAGGSPPASGKVYHFDASILTDADGTALATWTNQGSEGNLTQGGGTLQPLVKTNILNGNRIVRFDGSNDWMVTPTITALPQPFHIFLVCNVIAGTYVFDSRSGTQLAFLAFPGGSLSLYAGTAMIGATQALPSGFHRWRFATGATDTVHKDGAAFASGNAGANGLNGLSVGASNAGGERSQVDVAEIIVYSRVLDAGEITTVESYLTAKWGV